MKFEMIGVSMISPDGLAIRPRIPESCFIWAAEPRAPELAIMKMEFTPRAFFLPSSIPTDEICFIMS